MLTWAAVLGIGLILVVGGLRFVLADLDRADKTASVVGAVVALLGFGLSAYALVLTRRGLVNPSGPGAQTVDRVDAGQDVDVIDGRTRPDARAPGAQTVSNVRAGGSVRVIRGHDGDLDIPR